jgi:hypothetical protein
MEHTFKKAADVPNTGRVALRIGVYRVTEATKLAIAAGEDLDGRDRVSI